MTIPQSGKKDRKNNNSTHRKEKKIRTLTIPESDKNHAKIKQITIPESEKAIEKTMIQHTTEKQKIRRLTIP